MSGYGTLAGLVVLAGALPALLCLLLRRPPARWWLAVAVTLVALLVLTAVFDSLMILADLFRYGAQVQAGPRLGIVPLGDFSWPIAVALGLPSLWRLIGARPHGGRSAGPGRGALR